MHSNRCKKPIMSANAGSSHVQANIKSGHYKFEMTVKVQAHIMITFTVQTHALNKAVQDHPGYL